MMFLVSEVHPFVDGNGRAARIMMNAELVAEDEQRIIIPTVYRNDYLTALKALSQSEKPTPVIRVLDFAQKYTGSIRWDDFDTARSDLQQTNAFRDSTEAEDHGVRLVIAQKRLVAPSTNGGRLTTLAMAVGIADLQVHPTEAVEEAIPNQNPTVVPFVNAQAWVAVFLCRIFRLPPAGSAFCARQECNQFEDRLLNSTRDF